jgi:hypothetical protein
MYAVWLCTGPRREAWLSPARAACCRGPLIGLITAQHAQLTDVDVDVDVVVDVAVDVDVDMEASDVQFVEVPSGGSMELWPIISAHMRRSSQWNIMQSWRIGTSEDSLCGVARSITIMCMCSTPTNGGVHYKNIL